MNGTENLKLHLSHLGLPVTFGHLYFTDNSSLIVAIYVDDILIFWKDETVRKKLKTSLSAAFKMKDMGKAANCVGLHITYGAGTIRLDQSKYTQEILQRFGMAECKPAVTPSDVNEKLSVSMCPSNERGKEDMAKIPYQEAVGCLLYLVQGTRPDIAFAVNDVSRFNSNFGKAHWMAVKRIFRYLKGTLDYGLSYTNSAETGFIGYSDADWASDIYKRRSCTGYVFKLSVGAISWGSKRHATVALSSTEAQYMAISAAIQEGIWLKQFGQQLDVNIKERAVKLGCDNQSALSLAETSGYRARSKHIDVRHHYIREKIADRTVEMYYIPTERMVADSLTKAVNGQKNKLCFDNMGFVCVSKKNLT